MRFLRFSKRNQDVKEVSVELLKGEQQKLGKRIFDEAKRLVDDKGSVDKHILLIDRMPENAGTYSIFIGAHDAESHTIAVPGYQGYSLMQIHVIFSKTRNTIEVVSGAHTKRTEIFADTEIDAALEYINSQISQFSLTL